MTASAVAASRAVPPAAADAPIAAAPPGTADHLRALYVQTPATLVGYLLGLAVIVAVYWPWASPLRLWGWAGALLVLWLLRLAHYLRFRRSLARAVEAADGDVDPVLRWRRSWAALVLLQGSLWGIASWLFWGLGDAYDKLALILVVYTYCVSSVQLLATQPWVFGSFTSLVLLPTIARIATDTGQAGHATLAVIVALLFAATILMARTYGTALGQAIALKARTDALAAQLRREIRAGDDARRAAEDARRVAEAASRAKTQFFAAASHDLRQPLHAMGLFAEALRERSHDPEVAPLVNSINESVDALEGLFGELLDITRIDSGGVDVKPQPVRMRELFARLRLHFEPAAFEKGLMLKFRGGDCVAEADPVLLERVLRNLVSNAIRYTDDGGVLVTCRTRRRGDTAVLLVQVWDSGVGIAPANLPRIWDEFFQGQAHRPLQAHHRKGLGLGLAIVKRLAALLGAPIDVRSRVGHGTLFSLEVPQGRLARTTDGDVDTVASKALGLTLEGRAIVVIEDEAAVRDGLVVLLQAWGATVAAFETVSALRAWLSAPTARAPDLAIVDYRLPEGCTGVDALVALRERWPDRRLPAIVVTGSSLVGHEDEAVTHDYHLLIKPVLPNKLRAMIAFKLALRR